MGLRIWENKAESMHLWSVPSYPETKLACRQKASDVMSTRPSLSTLKTLSRQTLISKPRATSALRGHASKNVFPNSAIGATPASDKTPFAQMEETEATLEVIQMCAT